jgi:hypothetical protein
VSSEAKGKEVTVRVHKAVRGCCRAKLIEFAARDRYQGAGEPGDKIRCGCGQRLVYDYRGWRPVPVLDQAIAEAESTDR